MTTWQVTNGQSIQAVIAGASDGDTIAVDAGVYAENLTIDKAVTILGANHGIAGTGARESETIIMGTTRPSAVRTGGLEAVESAGKALAAGAADATRRPPSTPKRRGVDSLTGVISVTSLNSHTCNVGGRLASGAGSTWTAASNSAEKRPFPARQRRRI
jgi:nucleoid-associated protein YgaU